MSLFQYVITLVLKGFISDFIIFQIINSFISLEHKGYISMIGLYKIKIEIRKNFLFCSISYVQPFTFQIFCSQTLEASDDELLFFLSIYLGELFVTEPTVQISPTQSPEDRNRFSFQNAVFFRVLYDGRSPETQQF